MDAKRSEGGHDDPTTPIVSGELCTVDPVEAHAVVTGELAPEEAARRTLPSASAERPSPTSALPTMHPARFVGVRSIGAGGMGAVRLVFDRVLRRTVAQKTIQKSLADRPGFAMRFIEEAQITSQLDHPNVVPAYDLCLTEDGQEIVFMMKPIAGETLSKLARDAHKQPFSGEVLERLVRVVLKVCEAVSFAHARGVLHLDLKPDNIMVGSHGQVYVMDWGVARLMTQTRGSEHEERVRTSRAPADGEAQIAGSPAFLSPEQARADKEGLSERSDVYGIGAILYYLLSGHGPSYRDDARAALLAAREGKITPLGESGAWSELPPGLCDIVTNALAHAPEDRHASVADLQAELEDFLRGGGWFRRRQFRAGETILREGEPGKTAYIVVSGQCEITRSLGSRPEVVRTVGPREIFGETAILTDQPRSASVVAKTDVCCLEISKATLARELERSDWLRILVEALAHRFREADVALARERREREP